MTQLTFCNSIFLGSLIIISSYSNAQHDKISKHDAKCKNLLLFFICLILSPLKANGEIGFFDSIIKKVTPHFSLRYRYEHVDDNALQTNGATLNQADASTLRTLLGLETGPFHGFSARVDVENVIDIGGDHFNDVSNGKTQFATVVDPSGTELEQGFLKFTGFENTIIKGGRQHITYRKAPFHRYIGTILWRQNWQNYDAISITNTSLTDTTINYAYLWNVNRIFGHDAREPLSHFDSNSHFINLKYDGFKFGKLEGYAYILDFDNAATFSTKTYGVRFNGGHPLIENTSLLYTLEYASQSDNANNTADIDADYFLGEAGIKFKPLIKIINSIILKFSYELLTGDGGSDRFVTTLGTNHAFQGWADRFLVTPGDGIEDFYGSFIMNIWGTKFVAVYHNYFSDRDSYDYGSELNLLLTKTFKKKYSLGLKYADYDADRNVSNVARNASQSREKSIFWAFVQFKY